MLFEKKIAFSGIIWAFFFSKINNQDQLCLIAEIKNVSIVFLLSNSKNLTNFLKIVFFAWKIMKTCILEMVQEHLKMCNYNFTEDHEQAWNKFLTLMIECMIKRENAIGRPT